MDQIVLYHLSFAGTWKSTCTYSSFLANKTPMCCASLSTFYNPTITSCPKCSCGCREADKTTVSCTTCVLIVEYWLHSLAMKACRLRNFGCFLLICLSSCCASLNATYLSLYCSVCSSSNPDLVQCTDHMCPVGVHWHIKNNYMNQWRVKLTISNYNYQRNFSDWNVLVQHPGFSQPSTAYSFNSTMLPIVGFGGTYCRVFLSIIDTWYSTCPKG